MAGEELGSKVTGPEGEVTPEVEGERKLRVLVLEDRFQDVVQEGIGSLGWVDLKVVGDLEELSSQDPEEFQPDIIILDRMVPQRKGEEPQNLITKSNSLVQEKFPKALTVGYSVAHGGADLERTPLPGYVLLGEVTGGEINTSVIEDIREKMDREARRQYRDIYDKSNPNSWKSVLELSPGVTTNYRWLSERMPALLKSISPEARKQMTKIFESVNPELIGSLKRGGVI